jgi:hypothetical protein
MKKQITTHTESQKEELIQDALRTGGFLFPQTVAEVEEFEKKFGTTNVPLPEELKIPHFLEKAKSKKTAKAKTTAVENEHFSMAARDGAPKLPDEILRRMEEDRKKAIHKPRKNNPKKK